MSKEFINNKKLRIENERGLKIVCPELYFSLSVAKLIIFIFGMGHLIRTAKEQGTK